MVLCGAEKNCSQISISPPIIQPNNKNPRPTMDQITPRRYSNKSKRNHVYPRCNFLHKPNRDKPLAIRRRRPPRTPVLYGKIIRTWPQHYPQSEPLPHYSMLFWFRDRKYVLRPRFLCRSGRPRRVFDRPGSNNSTIKSGFRGRKAGQAI